MRWRIFYISGESFSSGDGSPEDASGGGVLAVAQEDKHVGVTIHHGSDFYVFAEQYGGWYGLDYFGLAQHLVRPGLKVIKLGESMNVGRYRELLAEVRRDPNLPIKCARYPWEVPV